MSLRLLSALTAQGDVHTDSTDEAVLASYEIPGSFWQVGKIIKFRGAAIVADNNSTDTATIRVRIGGTTLTGTAIFTSAAVDSADGDVCVIEGEIVCRSVGASGVVVAAVSGSNPDAATIATGAHVTVVSSLDTTAAMLLELTADWSVAHADNQVAAEFFTVYEIV